MDWRVWAELLVRSGALLLAGEALRRVSRPLGANFRHRLLLWMFVLLALMPVLSIVFPEIPVSVWSRAHETRALVTAAEVSRRAVQPSASYSINWLLWVWISGVAVSCLPLVVGWISVWRLGRRSSELQNPLLREAARELARVTEVRISRPLRVPVTCGLLKHRVLLPAAAEGWSKTRLEAVLRHELAHIRRRDLAVQLGAHLVAALWWFQPLVWIMRRELRAESEFACDAEALKQGVRPSEYAAELLGVAQSFGRDWTLSSSVIGMVRSGDLEARLKAILQPPAAQFGRRRIYVIGLALVASSVMASAVGLHPGEGSMDQGGSMMKRTILSALLTSAGLSAATIGGYVHDANGVAISDAKVSVLDPESSAKQEAVTDATGKFSLEAPSAGQYILRIEKPGMASIFRAFDVKTDSKMERDFTMTGEGSATVADSWIGPPDGPSKPIRVGGMVAQSNLMTKIQPVYPVAAKKAGVQGTVEISATISKDGVPVTLSVMSSPSDDLSESALEAVRQWRYRPTLLNGQPVEIETMIVVNYTLSK